MTLTVDAAETSLTFSSSVPLVGSFDRAWIAPTSNVSTTLHVLRRASGSNTVTGILKNTVGGLETAYGTQPGLNALGSTAEMIVSSTGSNGEVFFAVGDFISSQAIGGRNIFFQYDASGAQLNTWYAFPSDISVAHGCLIARNGDMIFTDRLLSVVLRTDPSGSRVLARYAPYGDHSKVISCGGIGSTSGCRPMAVAEQSNGNLLVTVGFNNPSFTELTATLTFVQEVILPSKSGRQIWGTVLTPPSPGQARFSFGAPADGNGNIHILNSSSTTYDSMYPNIDMVEQRGGAISPYGSLVLGDSKRFRVRYLSGFVPNTIADQNGMPRIQESTALMRSYGGVTRPVGVGYDASYNLWVLDTPSSTSSRLNQCEEPNPNIVPDEELTLECSLFLNFNTGAGPPNFPNNLFVVGNDLYVSFTLCNPPFGCLRKYDATTGAPIWTSPTNGELSFSFDSYGYIIGVMDRSKPTASYEMAINPENSNEIYIADDTPAWKVFDVTTGAFIRTVNPSPAIQRGCTLVTQADGTFLVGSGNVLAS